MTKKEFDTVKIGDVVLIPNGCDKGYKYIVRYIENESILGKYSEYLNGTRSHIHLEFRVANYRSWSIEN